MNIDQCTQHLLSQDDKGDYWNSYTLFYTHIDNLCFYYKSEGKFNFIMCLGWQQNTEDLIDSLYKASEQLKNEIMVNSFDAFKFLYYTMLVITGTL
jgi:hypothetical protein